jgi:hypothetical protein
VWLRLGAYLSVRLSERYTFALLASHSPDAHEDTYSLWVQLNQRQRPRYLFVQALCVVPHLPRAHVWMRLLHSPTPSAGYGALQCLIQVCCKDTGGPRSSSLHSGTSPRNARQRASCSQQPSCNQWYVPWSKATASSCRAAAIGWMHLYTACGTAPANT